MSKYEFDGSDYENWKPSDFPVGYVCPEGGTSKNIERIISNLITFACKKVIDSYHRVVFFL